MEGRDGTQELALPETTPGNSEAGPLLASLQEPMRFPRESSVTFEFLLWKTMLWYPGGQQGNRALKSDRCGLNVLALSHSV